MDEHCKGRKCLKEINPEVYPGVYWGTPWEHDPDTGCCIHCDYYNEGKLPNLQSIPKLLMRKREIPQLEEPTKITLFNILERRR